MAFFLECTTKLIIGRASLTAEHPTCTCMCAWCMSDAVALLWTLSHSLASQTRAQLPQSLIWCLTKKRKRSEGRSESGAWSWLDWERWELPVHSHPHQPPSGWSAVTLQHSRSDQWLCLWGRPAGSRAGWHAAHCTSSLRACSVEPEPGLLRRLWGLICTTLSLSSPADSWGLAKELSLCRGYPIPLPCPWSTGSLPVSSHICPPAVTSDIADLCPCLTPSRICTC